MLIRGDARTLPLRDACVQCVVTSPPYFGLRDYNTAGQIGLEASPDAYVAEIVAVFREVWRVLRDDGTCWLNLGDSFASGTKGSGGIGKGLHAARVTQYDRNQHFAPIRIEHGQKPKDLLGIPWRVAFALQADGWYLRSDIIWHKPNPMPESVTDRPTKAHEYLFLLAKSERYYYDADAIAEPNSVASIERYAGGTPRSAIKLHDNPNRRDGGAHTSLQEARLDGRNRRSVWTVPTAPYSGAHFATMPPQLVEPCILAGCPVGGLVLDPFVGSGTVIEVAARLGRRAVGLDLAYQRLAAERTQQRGLPFLELVG